MLERLASVVILLAPVVTFAMDPATLTQPALYLYFLNVAMQLCAMAIFCRFLWTRWSLATDLA